MIQITPHQQLCLAIQPTDFRKGIDGLVALCRQHLKQDPFSGKLFVFTNKRKIAIKILVYDGQGFWLCLKRFSKGKLAWWPTTPSPLYSVTHQQLQILLYQGHPLDVKIPEDWRPILTPPLIHQ